MPRKQPTEKVDTLGELDIMPVNVVGEYFASKTNNNNFMKPPNFDSSGDQLESIYILTKLEHESYQKQLQALRENQELQKTINLQRLRRVSKDQDQLRERLVVVNRILRDMGEKKKIAHRKINLEMEMQKELNEEIEMKTKRYNELKVFRKALKATAAEYKMYESVLESAVKKAKYDSMHTLISYCDSIMGAQGDISKLNDEMIGAIEGMRKRIVDIIKQAELIYGGLMNELAQMSRSYSKSQYECLKWERIMLNTNTAIIERKRANELVRDGINQIYRLMCAKKNINPTLVRKDVIKTLDFIWNEIEVWTDVVAEYNKKNEN